jgi:hypothetical protein
MGGWGQRTKVYICTARTDTKERWSEWNGIGLGMAVGMGVGMGVGIGMRDYQ